MTSLVNQDGSVNEVVDLRSKTVDHIIGPLFSRMRQFDRDEDQTNRKSHSKPKREILSAIQDFIFSLRKESCSIIRDTSTLLPELETASTDVLNTAEHFSSSAAAFLDNPSQAAPRKDFSRSANALLSATSRLLILADLSDISALTGLFQDVLNGIEAVKSSSSHRELISRWNDFHPRLIHLLRASRRRARDSVDPSDYRVIEGGCYVLENNSTLLLSSSKVALRHPEHSGIKGVQNCLANSVFDAVEQIQSVIEGNHRHGPVHLKASGKLLEMLEEFENGVLIDPGITHSNQIPVQMERRLKQLLPSIYKLINSPLTPPAQRVVIDKLCQTLRQALADLLVEYTNKPVNRSRLEKAMQNILNITNPLRQYLIRVAVIHVSESFLRKDHYLMALRDATKFGNEQRMDSASQNFQSRSISTVMAANQICSLSTDEEIAYRAQLACQQIELLVPQLVNAAYLLFKNPKSRSVEANFEAFCKAYEHATEFLHTSVNELISIHEFLAVSDDQLLLEYQNSLNYLESKEESEFQEACTSMQCRSAYICQTVLSIMNTSNAENLSYVDQVMERVTILRDQFIPNFVSTARDTISRLAAQQSFDGRSYRKAGRDLCNEVHRLRLAALNHSDLRSDVEMLKMRDRLDSERDEPNSDEGQDLRTKNSKQTDSSPTIFRLQTRCGKLSTQEDQRIEREEIYSSLTDPQRETMAEQLAGFVAEKKRFMREVVKWDDSANEIIVLAKKMCVIMMEMTDFIRGKGPLNSTLHVIQAAQHISELGQRLDRLCREIAKICPDSSSRRDLLAYLQRVTLYCHQLNITSRVKAGVHIAGDEVFESATSLIQAAKNLMTAVVLTVKESYIASTKYRGSSQRSIVRWQMRTPEKKPLVTRPNESMILNDRYSDDELISNWPRHPDALTELSQFKHPPPN